MFFFFQKSFFRPEKYNLNKKPKQRIYGGLSRVANLGGKSHSNPIQGPNFWIQNLKKNFHHIWIDNLFLKFQSIPKTEKRMDGSIISFILGVRRGSISQPQGKKRVLLLLYCDNATEWDGRKKTRVSSVRERVIFLGIHRRFDFFASVHAMKEIKIKWVGYRLCWVGLRDFRRKWAELGRKGVGWINFLWCFGNKCWAG